MLKFIVAALLTLPLFLAPPAMATQGPLEPVRQATERALEILSDPDLDSARCATMLRKLIAEQFDFALMSRWTLGPYWRKADAEQRRRFIDLYGQLLEASYLGKIMAYEDEQVRFLNEQIDDGNRAEVATEIVTDGADIPITYRLIHKEGNWRVYDVVIEGVSLVRNYRSSFGEIVRREGIEGLLRQLKKKIAAQKADNRSRS